MSHHIKLDDTHSILKTDLLGTHSLEATTSMGTKKSVFSGSYTQCFDEAKRRNKSQ